MAELTIKLTLTLTFVSNSDPCQIITPLVLVGLGLGVGEGLGLGNHIAISTRGVIICQGSKMGTTPAYLYQITTLYISIFTPYIKPCVAL